MSVVASSVFKLSLCNGNISVWALVDETGFSLVLMLGPSDTGLETSLATIWQLVVVYSLTGWWVVTSSGCESIARDWSVTPPVTTSC